MLNITDESILSEMDKIFDTENYNKSYFDNDDIFFDETLSIFDVSNNINDTNIACNELERRLNSNNNISMEANFFKKVWDFIVMIIKKMINAVVKFFKVVVNFFKRIFNVKNDIKKDCNEILKDKEKFDDISSNIMDKIINDDITPDEDVLNSTESNSINNKYDITIIIPGKEEEYIKILHNNFKKDFLIEFKKISFYINNFTDIMITDRSHDNIVVKINEFEAKHNEYKKKMNELIEKFKENKVKYIIQVDKNNGRNVIKNALYRNTIGKNNSNDILKAVDNNNCNRMLNSLIRTIKKVQSKTNNTDTKYQSTVKKLSILMNNIVSLTNKLFSEVFSYVRMYMITENINTKIAKFAVDMFRKTKKQLYYKV